MNKPMTALNPKRTRFVQEYAIDFNATQAAIRAGYSKRNAESIGYQLLQKTPVQAAIKASMEKVAAKSELSAQWVLDGLKIIAVQGVREKDYSASNRAFELIGKHIGMFVERSLVLTKPFEGMTQEDVDRELEQLEREARALAGIEDPQGATASPEEDTQCP